MNHYPYSTNTGGMISTGFPPVDFSYPDVFGKLEPSGTVIDDDGDVVAITPDGMRINVSKWAKREIISKVKDFLEDVVSGELSTEDGLVELVNIRILMDMYKEEVEMSQKYLDLAVRGGR